MNVFVLADTMEQFADWCVRNGVNPLGVRCVLNPRDLRGKIKSGDRLIDARAQSPVMCQPGLTHQMATAGHS